jgi:bacterioferritin
MLQGDLKMITAIRVQLIETIGYYESISDYVSRELLEEILEHTENHLD